MSFAEDCRSFRDKVSFNEGKKPPFKKIKKEDEEEGVRAGKERTDGFLWQCQPTVLSPILDPRAPGSH